MFMTLTVWRNFKWSRKACETRECPVIGGGSGAMYNIFMGGVKIMHVMRWMAS